MEMPKSGIFAAAEIGNVVSKEDYEAALEDLRVELLNLQYDLRQANFSVIILLAGDDRPGAIATARTLHEWIDMRYVTTSVMFDEPRPEEAQRPVMWRYWMNMPQAGRMGLFLGGWPVQVVRMARDSHLSALEFEGIADHAERFERELALDGVLLLKFWMHLPKGEHERRLADAAEHPEKHWQFENRDWDVLREYDKSLMLVERLIRRTNTPLAPWSIIESTNARFRNLAVGRQIVSALKARLENPPPQISPAHLQLETGMGQNLLDQLDMTATADPDSYSSDLAALQARLNELARAASEAEVASVIVFEGVDAAGKGGTIRRITAAIPIQQFRVVPIAAPTEEERAHHYMWRFWRQLPRKGEIRLFDRSWYGRVLVERVEGFASEAEWGRAYEELNDFEALLDQGGLPVIKFWLQIDAEEQLKRFEARGQTPYKKYKLTDEDYRNREKWDLYQQAAHDMVARTNTSYAPWYVISANDKKHARLTALEVVCDRLEARLVETVGEDWRKLTAARLEALEKNGRKKKAAKAKKG